MIANKREICLCLNKSLLIHSKSELNYKAHIHVRKSNARTHHAYILKGSDQFSDFCIMTNAMWFPNFVFRLIFSFMFFISFTEFYQALRSLAIRWSWIYFGSQRQFFIKWIVFFFFFHRVFLRSSSLHVHWSVKIVLELPTLLFLL